MRFRIDQRFTHPLEAVEAALVDRGFLEARGGVEELGSPALLEQWEEGDVVHQRVRYRFVGELSPAVTAVVDPARLTWVEEVSLDRGAHRANHRIVPDHYAGRLRCTYATQLTSEAAGSVRVAEGDLKVGFPLVGGRVERAIVSGLSERGRLEAELLDRWLEGAAG